MIEILRRVWPFIKPYKTRLILGLTFGILFAASNGALVLTIEKVVNLLFPMATGESVSQHMTRVPEFIRPLAQRVASWIPEFKSPATSAGKILLICCIPVVVLFRNLCSYLNVYLVMWAAARAIADLRSRLFGHLQDLSLDFYNQAKTGDLISRITNDTHVLHQLFSGSLASIVKDPVTVIVLAMMLVTQQPRLTLVSVIVLPVCLGPIIIYGRKVRKSARAMQGHISEMTSLMHESFTGHRIIKAYNLEERVLAQFVETTRKYVGHIMRVTRANEIPSQLTEFLGAVGVALVLSSVSLTDGGKSSGDMVAFMLSIVLMYQPIKSLARLHNQLHQASAASQRVFELLDATASVTDPPSPVPLKAKNADIRFRDVDFDYGDKAVLRGINLTVKAGQLVALVGRSGSGKTTLTNLLLRFYDPVRGSIQIGDTDIRRVAIKDLRNQIALVTQETVLFNDTIRNNIALGRVGATSGEVETAAKHAYAEEFILEKPQRYDTIIGEKGANLSGGQRQRLAIARAIVKDAPILILDEATSSLDSESERAVQAAFEDLMQGRTTICIAHRLSTIQKADVIVVLDQGRIVESGTHAELIQSRGAYCRFYELQVEPAMA